MNGLLFLLDGAAVTVFGSLLSASFCHVLTSARKRILFWCCIAAILLMQGWLSTFMDTTYLHRIYPLLVHLPLALVQWFLTKKKLWSIVAVLTAYLCCQLRRWLALLIAALGSGGEELQIVIKLLLTVPLLILILKYVSPVVRQLSYRTMKVQCLFGFVPLLYYVFDYVTVVYTDLLITNSLVVVEFMPFVCCLAYLLFLLYYSTEEQKRNRSRQVQETLNIRLKQSVREISALRESQMLARQYRHDLRHHLQYISACIENEQFEQAQRYISGISQEIEAQKVAQYCENDAANLILSSFVRRAGKQGIEIRVQGNLPVKISLSDSDLCVLLCNALENALHACQKIEDAAVARLIELQFYKRDDKIFLQVTNPCSGNVRFDKGIPVSNQPNHGLGVQSICAVVERYHGIYSFSVQEGKFILRLSV